MQKIRKEELLMNTSKLRELIKERSQIDAQNDVLAEQNHNVQFELLSDNLQETMDFLNSCSPEELYWVSELFEKLSNHFKSQELIDCMECNAKRTGVDCAMDIEYAKEALNY